MIRCTPRPCAISAIVGTIENTERRFGHLLITQPMPYDVAGNKASQFEMGACVGRSADMKEPNSVQKRRMIFKERFAQLSPLDIHSPSPRRRSRRSRRLIHQSGPTAPDAYAPPLHLAGATSSTGVSFPATTSCNRAVTRAVSATDFPSSPPGHAHRPTSQQPL